MASCYGWMGEDAATTVQAATILALKSEFTTAAHTADLPYKNEADCEHHRKGLLKAGLPN